MKTKQQKLTSCEWQAISNTSLPWRVLGVYAREKDTEKERKWDGEEGDGGVENN